MKDLLSAEKIHAGKPQPTPRYPGASYVLFRGGCQERQPAESFQLHGNQNDFASCPRVFTTFAVLPLESEGATHTVAFLKAHFRRLFWDASQLSILNKDLPEHDEEWLRSAFITALRSYPGQQPGQVHPLRIRLVLSLFGAELFIDGLPPSLPSLRLGGVLILRTLPEHKTSNTLASRKARAEAQKQNFDDALLIDPVTQEVREGAWSNFFWFDELGLLHTSNAGVLPGVTRGAVLELQSCNMTEISLPSLCLRAREAFITQSTSGITPVIEINGQRIGAGTPGPLVKDLQARYREAASRNSTRVSIFE